jgi:hypothetical protein
MRFPLGAAAPAQAFEPLWWPPGKVAGRLLAPYLSEQPEDLRREQLRDLAPAEAEAQSAHADALELALAAADASARAEDYESALRWLAAVEHLEVVVPIEYTDRRRAWREALAEQQSG